MCRICANPSPLVQEIVDHLTYLLVQCHEDYSKSGQLFTTDHGGYNVNIAFCDSNDSPDTPPSAYTAPGPNGHPEIQCGGNLEEQCDGASCNEGSIVMETQEPVTCEEWLAPTYIGAGATYTYSTTRTVGTTWSVGGFLVLDTSDLAPVSVPVGFFSSFANTTTSGDTSGITSMCGDEGAKGNWTCASKHVAGL